MSENDETDEKSLDVAYREACADIAAAIGLLQQNRPLQALCLLRDADERHDPPTFDEEE